MDNRLESYKIWAPDNALWTQWAKPVLFSQYPRLNSIPMEVAPNEKAPPADGKTAFIVDMPGANSVFYGLSLAKRGYRPVPLYNGVYGPNKNSMAVDVTDIVTALYANVGELSMIPIPANAPPAFLLDSNRMRGGRSPGMYDNRWCVFPQDMPSADFLLNHGIHQVYVCAITIENDLLHILHRYKEKGIPIYHETGNGKQYALQTARPSLYRSLLYRFSIMVGLKRNAAGGFGGTIPEATQYSGGHRYGIG